MWVVNCLLDGAFYPCQDVEYLEEIEVQYGDATYSVQLDGSVLETYERVFMALTFTNLLKSELKALVPHYINLAL